MSNELTLEQQFSFRLMTESAKGMTRKQAIALLLQSTEILITKQNYVAEFHRHILEKRFGKPGAIAHVLKVPELTEEQQQELSTLRGSVSLLPVDSVVALLLSTTHSVLATDNEIRRLIKQVGF
jgi:hypothetical protein